MTAGVSSVPDSSSDSTEYGKYGAVYDFSYAELDSAVQSETGKTLEEWVDYVSSLFEHYHFSAEPSIDATFATSRDIVRNGNDYMMTDRTTGYLDFSFSGQANGNFPAAGTYYPNEGETSLQFLYRVFITEGLEEPRDTHIDTSIQLYVDLLSVTHVDLSSGEVTGSNVELKVAMYEKDDRNISFAFKTDDDYNPVSATIGYDQSNIDSNFYLDFQVDLAMDGMRLFTDDASPWSLTPTVREHVQKSVISSDLANSIWAQFIEAEGDDRGGSLPELILELIGSGGRMLDLFDTIKSLTSSDVPDASMTGSFEAENYTDTNGYDYCKLTLLKYDSTPGTTVEIPKAGYVLRWGELVQDIPDYLISPAKKTSISLILAAIGWNDIDVCDISHNQTVQNRIASINSYVNEKIVEDDIPSYHVPIEYTISAAVGLSLTAILLILVRRRAI